MLDKFSISHVIVTYHIVSFVVNMLSCCMVIVRSVLFVLNC